MKINKRAIVERLSEPSTYRGIVLLLTAAGITIRPELAAALTSIGLGVAGLIGILMSDSAPDGAGTSD